MIITAISDLHNRKDVLDMILRQATDSDVLLFPGDLTNFGTATDAQHIVERARQTDAAVFAVAGNCDNAGVERALETLGVSLSGRGSRLQEVGFFGVSGIPPWQPHMYCFPEEDIAARLAAGAMCVSPCRAAVAVTHVPPYGTNADRNWMGAHCGSHAVRSFVEKEQPALLICGHIHEARGSERLGRTLVVNCGAANAGHFVRISMDSIAQETGPHIQVDFLRV